VSAKSANDFDNILSASERWMRAWQAQDRAALEKVLAPDFTLPTLDRKSTVHLAEFRGSRPVVLVFGSYT